MNVHFVRLGMTPVERIPVLGRTGPDLSINELKLVVDVKSRIEVPKALFFPLTVPFTFDHMTAVRLTNLYELWEENFDDCFRSSPLAYSSKTVRDYLEHMEEWTAENCKDGVSCIVLHRPELPIGSCVAIIHSRSRRRLIEHARQHRNNTVSAE
jgi:hypothetical protein